MLLVLTLACAPAAIDLGQTPVAGTDTNKTDTEPTDTTPPTGTDPTDTSDTTDTTPTEPERDDSGDYVGAIAAGVYSSSGWGDVECGGDVSFSIDTDGVMVGEAACDASWIVFTGALDGTAVDGVVEGSWLVSLGWGDPVAIPFSGEVEDGEAYVTIETDLGWAMVSGDVEAVRE